MLVCEPRIQMIGIVNDANFVRSSTEATHLASALAVTIARVVSCGPDAAVQAAQDAESRSLFSLRRTVRGSVVDSDALPLGLWKSEGRDRRRARGVATAGAADAAAFSA